MNGLKSSRQLEQAAARTPQRTAHFPCNRGFFRIDTCRRKTRIQNSRLVSPDKKIVDCLS